VESTSHHKSQVHYLGNLIFYAGIFLKRIEDKEDAVQNAHLLYLIYKDSFKTGTQEQILKWLVKQECFKILKYKKQWRNKINYIEDLPTRYSEEHSSINIEENMHEYTSKCNYNEAPQELDREYLQKQYDLYLSYPHKDSYRDGISINQIKKDYINDKEFVEIKVFSSHLISPNDPKRRHNRITTRKN